jgi:hypothetical protein
VRIRVAANNAEMSRCLERIMVPPLTCEVKRNWPVEKPLVSKIEHSSVNTVWVPPWASCPVRVTSIKSVQVTVTQLSLLCSTSERVMHDRILLPIQMLDTRLVSPQKRATG